MTIITEQCFDWCKQAHFAYEINDFYLVWWAVAFIGVAISLIEFQNAFYLRKIFKKIGYGLLYGSLIILVRFIMINV